MDGEPRSRRPVLALLAVAALLVGLAVYGAIAFFGDDGDDGPAKSTAGTTVPSRLPTTVSPSVSTTTGASSTDPASPQTGSGTEPSADGTQPPANPTGPGTATTVRPPPRTAPDGSELPGYDSEACIVFRELLDLVDDPALRSAAAEVGCI